MSLIATLQKELTAAMKEREAERRDALRLILSSLQSAEKELQRPLTEDEELQVLQRERKRRLESIEAFEAGGRAEQAAKEEGELEVLREVSPKNGYRFGISMEFADQAAYDAYNSHPDHVRFVETRWLPEVSDFLEIDYAPRG